MKRLIILLLALGFVLGCGKKKEEVIVTKTGETAEQKTGKTADTVKEKIVVSKDAEEEGKSPPDENRGSGNRNTQEYVNIKTSEAASKVGSMAVVTGYVADVTIREKVAYLNFDGKYPKNTFTAVIFPDKYELFGDLMSYKNKTVEVKGKIGQYGGKPQIILNNKNQIRVMK
jgi:DNA/RNA endonuclease YhcR with UshA esterase domain